MFELSSLISGLINAQKAKKQSFTLPLSSFLLENAAILYAEGFLRGYRIRGSFLEKKRPTLEIFLKYQQGRCSFLYVKQISSPGKKVYISNKSLCRTDNPLKTFVVSTSEGIVSSRNLKKQGLGGELLYEIF